MVAELFKAKVTNHAGTRIDFEMAGCVSFAEAAAEVYMRFPNPERVVIEGY